jgi:hypothetical protein
VVILGLKQPMPPGDLGYTLPTQGTVNSIG